MPTMQSIAAVYDYSNYDLTWFYKLQKILGCRVSLKNVCLLLLLAYICLFTLVFISLAIVEQHQTGMSKGLKSFRRKASKSQIWQESTTFYKFNNDMYVQAAFNDNRSNNGTIIRIFGLSRAMPWGYCLVDHVDPGEPEVAPMIVKYLSHAANKRNGSEEFLPISITCRLRVKLKRNPDYILISESIFALERHVKIAIPLHSMPQTRPQHLFTVCLGIFEGPIQQNTLIEFIEFHKILGVGHFYVYHYVGDSLESGRNFNIDAVLKHYEKNELITTVPWKLPLEKKLVYNIGSSVAKQHCLYQNMWSSQFMLFPDLYQYLIPLNATNWFNMLKPLNTSPEKQFCFQNYYFPPVAGDLLLTMSSLERVSLANEEMLCFIPPEHADLVEEHIKLSANHEVYVYVDAKEGFVHAYTPRANVSQGRDKLVPDKSSLRFKYELQIAYKRTARLIFEDK